MSDNKSIKVYGELKEVASFCEEYPLAFGLPPEEQRQRDIQYIVAIFVSSGMNLNGAYFLPSELIGARDTITGKALDVEHLDQYVVGSIYERAYLTKDRQLIDPVQALVEYGTKVDSLDMDIAVLMGLYKYRFPEVAQEVAEGKYKVSMECYYRDFDLKVGDVIISKDEANVFGFDTAGDASIVGKTVKLVEGKKECGFARIGRVFRDIMFSGCGLTEIPANPESDILATASDNNNDEILEGVVLDLTKSETYMKNKVAQEKIELSSRKEEENAVAEEDNKAVATGSPSSSNPGTCVHFKKYVYEYQPSSETAIEVDGEELEQVPKIAGVGDNPGPEDKIVAEKWCNLFDTECTSLAGDATDARCLRNVINSTTANCISSMGDLHMAIKHKEMELVDRVKEALCSADDVLSTFKPKI